MSQATCHQARPAPSRGLCPSGGRALTALLRACAAASLLFAFGCSLPPGCLGQDAAAAKKKSLEEINRRLEEKKLELEQYRLEEERISTELSGLKKRKSRPLPAGSSLKASLKGRARAPGRRARNTSPWKRPRRTSPGISPGSW